MEEGMGRYGKQKKKRKNGVENANTVAVGLAAKE